MPADVIREPTEQERAVRAVVLGGVLGAVLAFAAGAVRAERPRARGRAGSR